MINHTTGKENLPNLYIKRVTINSPNATRSKVLHLDVSLCAKDYIHTDNRLSWSSDSKIKKHLYGMVLVTNSAPLIASLSSGGEIMDKKAILRKYKTKGVYIEFKTFKLPSVEPDLHKLNSGDLYTYNIRKSFQTHKSSSSLAVFATFAMNLNSIIAVAGGKVDTKAGTYHGPVSSEIIMTGDTTPKNVYEYYSINGRVHHGPVHAHNGVIMEGSFHSVVPHERLYVRILENTKIVDLRPTQWRFKRPHRQEYKIPVFSNLYQTSGPDGSIKCIFSVNYDQLMRSSLDFGDHWDTLLALCQRFNMDPYPRVEVEIIREKIKSRAFAREKSPVKILSTETIGYISGFQSLCKFIKPTEDNLFPHVKFIELSNPETKNYKQVSKLFIDKDYVSEAQTGEKIMNISLIDKGVTLNSNQKVRYVVDLEIHKQKNKNLNQLLTKMEDNLSKLESFYKKMLSSSTSPPSIDASILDDMIMFKILLTESTATSEPLSFSREKLIVTNQTRASEAPGLGVFVEDFKKILMGFRKMFHIKAKQNLLSSIGMSQKVYYKKNKAKLTKRHTFTPTISSKDISSGFSFHTNPPLESNIFPSILTYQSSEQYFDYVEDHHNARYKKTTGFIPKGASYSGASMSPKMGEKNDKVTFLSPTMIKDGPTRLDLFSRTPLADRHIDIDHKQINKFISESVAKKSLFRSKPKVNFLFTPLRIGKFTFDKVEKEKDINYITAAEYVGKDSEFLNTLAQEHSLNKEPFNIHGEFTKIQKPVIDMLKSHFSMPKPRRSRSLYDKDDNKSIFKTKKNKIIPPQIMSLLGSKGGVLNPPLDKLKVPELSSKMEIDHFILQEVKYISGYRTTKDNKILVNAPIWSRYQSNTKLPSIGTNIMKMDYYTDNDLEIRPSSAVRLNVYDQYFHLYEEDPVIPSSPSAGYGETILTPPVPTDDSLSSAAAMTPPLAAGDGGEYATSNPITQNILRLGSYAKYDSGYTKTSLVSVTKADSVQSPGTTNPTPTPSTSVAAATTSQTTTSAQTSMQTYSQGPSNAY